MSPALISSWEKETSNASPPAHRLEAYATFFASERSVEREPYRVLDVEKLTAQEQARREELLDELIRLSDSQHGRAPAATPSPFDGTLLQFPVGEDITIVCSELPPERLRQVLNPTPEQPDYVAAYKYGDLDALLEMWGHLRAANPLSRVGKRTYSEMEGDDYATHLVLLGGIDWNPVTQEVMESAGLPVRQLEREDDSSLGGFEVGDGEERTLLEPMVQDTGTHAVLGKDVALFFRSVSPFNKKRTVTVCNGMHQWGTFGVVRALTDYRFRDRNEQYLRNRFAGTDTFSIITWVRVVRGGAITPDWSRSHDRLHEWPT